MSGYKEKTVLEFEIELDNDVIDWQIVFALEHAFGINGVNTTMCLTMARSSVWEPWRLDEDSRMSVANWLDSSHVLPESVRSFSMKPIVSALEDYVAANPPPLELLQ